MLQKNQDKIKGILDYHEDLSHHRLPQIVFLESSDFLQDEHAPANIHIGQEWVARRIDALMNSSYWPRSALFLTYDENGGMFDHVAPPEACPPDEIDALIRSESKTSSLAGDFRRYGFRVPFIAISPFAKRHFVSHQIYDHTSILKFIETKFNLPALTRRDANANNMYDLFDFSRSDLETGKLPRVSPRIDQIMGCLIKGLWSLF
jgi:phospholipase C